jgi:hypothetical protein
MGGAGKVLSYDRMSDGTVVVVQFQSGGWEGMLLRRGDEGSPQRAEVLKVHRPGSVHTVVFQGHDHVA